MNIDYAQAMAAALRGETVPPPELPVVLRLEDQPLALPVGMLAGVDTVTPPAEFDAAHLDLDQFAELISQQQPDAVDGEGSDL